MHLKRKKGKKKHKSKSARVQFRKQLGIFSCDSNYSISYFQRYMRHFIECNQFFQSTYEHNAPQLLLFVIAAATIVLIMKFLFYFDLQIKSTILCMLKWLLISIRHRRIIFIFVFREGWKANLESNSQILDTVPIQLMITKGASINDVQHLRERGTGHDDGNKG